jgi:uncharacterized protein (TIGR03083 family)
MTASHVDALRSSVARLRDAVAPMSDADLTGRAYPSGWSIADVLSHIGSGAVILQRRLDDTLAGQTTPDDFAPGVWETWNAKDPAAKRDDALIADTELLARIEAVTLEDRSSFVFAMGPMTFGFDEFIGLRLNEHAFHTWDIEVAGDPAATIPQQATELIVDNLELIARYTAKATGDATTITVATTAPARGFTIELQTESVTFLPTNPMSPADIDLPAEAFARLVYGRLDPDHTPQGAHRGALEVLRRTFPGP